MTNEPDKQPLDDRQLSALIAGSAIIAAFLAYWFVEIQAVREMLEMAYG